MASEVSDEELGRRVSAARGYLRESVSAFARRIDVERHELSKWETGQFGSPTLRRVRARKRQEALDLTRDATGLPQEFFAIDFNNLPKMVKAWHRATALSAGEDGPPDPEKAEGKLGEAKRLREQAEEDDANGKKEADG